MGGRLMGEAERSRSGSGLSRRRRIKVIAGPDLASVETSVKDWMTQGQRVTHLQIDYLPNQPLCQRWQAIMTYYPNPGAIRPPRPQCRRCGEKDGCQRYRSFLERR
ncbi:MAG: hypothetical protein QHH02_04460 [Syntrophomonadaceae bacterium]|nr:hypothetical protein [Syntrophomonadaceae bacterium]